MSDGWAPISYLIEHETPDGWLPEPVAVTPFNARHTRRALQLMTDTIACNRCNPHGRVRITVWFPGKTLTKQYVAERLPDPTPAPLGGRST